MEKDKPPQIKMKTDEELVTDARYLIAHPLVHFSTPEAREMLAACLRVIDDQIDPDDGLME